MKKFITLTLIACSALFFSCKQEDHTAGKGTSDNVNLSELSVEPRIGSVDFLFKNPTNPDYYYALVTYTNAQGEQVNKKLSVYNVDPNKGVGYTRARITGFEDTNTYEFTVTPYTAYGVAGKSEKISCAPEDITNTYKYIIETVMVEPQVLGGYVSWENEYGVPVQICVSFKDIEGHEQNLICESAKSEGMNIGSFAEPTTVKIVTKNKAGNLSSDEKTWQVSPEEGELPRTAMSVIDENGGVLGAGMAYDKLFDGNWQSTWHSSTSAAGDTYFVVDLGSVAKVAMVEVVRRTDDPGAIGYPETITIEVSKDNVSYTNVGTFEFNSEYVFNHLYKFQSSLARYIKLTLKHSGNWTHLAEFVAYTSATVTNRYAEEAAAELIPDPDDDDTYYPTQEYLRPMMPYDSWYNEDWYNAIAVSQPSPEENPALWVYETTGGDSWVPMGQLEADADGSVLVFRYKCTAALMCEFFWTAGGFPNNLAGGRETAFNVKKTSEWKTCKVNMTSAWAQHGWPGKAGDNVRFDIGNGAGETLTVNLMHWRAVTPDD